MIVDGSGLTLKTGWVAQDSGSINDQRFKHFSSVGQAADVSPHFFRQHELEKNARRPTKLFFGLIWLNLP